MAIGDVAGLLQPLTQASATYGDALVPLGRMFLAVVLLLVVLNAMLTWWMGQIGGAVAKAVRGLLIFSIPFTLLAGNNWLTTTGALAGFFQTEVTQPLLERAGGVGAQGGPELVKSLITKIANSVWPEEKNAAGEKNGWEKTMDFLSNPATSMGSAMFSSLTDFLFRVLLTIVAMGLMVATFFSLYAPLLMLQFGVILGPILICWLPFAPLADLARQWLKFMITSGMHLVVGVLMVLIASTSIDSFTTTMAGMGSAPDLPFYLELTAEVGGFLATASVMIFLTVMMFRGEGVASALVGGATEGGGVGAVIMQRVEKISSDFKKSSNPNPTK